MLWQEGGRKLLYVIGFGPGKEEGMTLQAREALKCSDIIVGYTTYIDLVRRSFPEKEYYSTAMKREVERCRFALEQASNGKKVAVISSGDSGVYGLAGLIYELSKEYPTVEIEVVAGVTAACSGAALLGAPLMHDFAVISLSDLMTPWEKIEQRIRYAAEAEFVLCLYNPSSKKRIEYLKKACQLIAEYRSLETVCGYVRNIGREKEEKKVLLLGELMEEKVDMFTTVFIGNEATKRIRDRMVTPRGYLLK